MGIWDPNTDALVTDLAMAVGSAFTNPRRNTYARQMEKAGYRPVIVAEGDSWFCYPTVVQDAPDDTIAQLGLRYPVYTEARPGDVASNMRSLMITPGGLLARIDYNQPDLLLLSAGGNDLLGDGLLDQFLPSGSLHRPEDYLAGEAFRSQVAGVVLDIEKIVRASLARLPSLKVILHGYAYPVPTGRGPWLQAPLLRLKIPKKHWRPILNLMVDAFHHELDGLANRVNAMLGTTQVYHVDLRDAVPDNLWRDELHPNTEGFGLVVTRFREAIEKIHPAAVAMTASGAKQPA